MAKEIIFYGVRHGETDWNKELRIQGYHDEPLNADGLAAVHRLGQELRSHPLFPAPTVIYSSDLSRATVTADVLSTHLEIPHHLDKRLRERNYGEFEGKTFRELEEEYGLSRIENYTPPGGEALEVFDLRVKAAVVEILSMNQDQTVLFVSHGGVLRSKMRHFGTLGSEGIGFDIQNLSLHTFQIADLSHFTESGK